MTLGNLEGVCLVTYLLYDETPLPVRTLAADGGAPRLTRGKQQKGLNKIMQSEMWLAFICRMRNGEFVSYYAPHICGLQVLERGTAECIQAPPPKDSLDPPFLPFDSAQSPTENPRCF
eukprot:2754372-Prorocentrum_lima.AAC.1